MKIGDIIAGFRKQKKVDGKVMAEELGISAVYLSQIETNKKMPSPELLTAIAAYFGIPMSALLFGVLEAKGFTNEKSKKLFESAKPIIDDLIKVLLTDESEAGAEKRKRAMAL